MAESSAPAVKAVIPVAGLGTRFLPVTKASPKELLPIIDKPAIEMVVEEAVAAGLTDVLMVTGRNKRAIEDHFDRAVELEETLAAKGDQARLAQVEHSTNLAQVHSVRQGAPLGLGHAVLCGAQHVGNEPFAVLLGDDLIDPRDPILNRMIAVQQATGGSVIALMEVPAENISMYGCAAVEATEEGDVKRVTALVEKPAVEEAPSNLAVIGRYVLHPRVFEVLRNTPPGRGGEIQLTDALAELANAAGSEGGGVYGVVFTGRRYDTGNQNDYLQCVVQLASEREDIAPSFVPWLKKFAAQLPD